jgi:hypothetical protein
MKPGLRSKTEYLGTCGNMKISMVYMLVDELPYRIQYICPVCERQNFQPFPKELDNLTCGHCRSVIDASAAEIQILSDPASAWKFHPPASN